MFHVVNIIHSDVKKNQLGRFSSFFVSLPFPTMNMSELFQMKNVVLFKLYYYFELSSFFYIDTMSENNRRGLQKGT